MNEPFSTDQKDHTEESLDAEQAWWKPALVLFSEVTGWIVIPLIAALYGGQYLDERQGTTNVYFLSLTAAAFIISCVGIGILGAKYIRQMERDSRDKRKGTEK